MPRNRRGRVLKAASYDAFLARLSGDGTTLQQQTCWGGSMDDQANGSVTALLLPTGQVLSRFVYDPNGAVQVLTANMTPGVADRSWRYLWQAGRYDWRSGSYNFRARDYSPSLMRWMQPGSLA